MIGTTNTGRFTWVVTFYSSPSNEKFCFCKNLGGRCLTRGNPRVVPCGNLPLQLSLMYLTTFALFNFGQICILFETSFVWCSSDSFDSILSCCGGKNFNQFSEFFYLINFKFNLILLLNKVFENSILLLFVLIMFHWNDKFIYF